MTALTRLNELLTLVHVANSGRIPQLLLRNARVTFHISEITYRNKSSIVRFPDASAKRDQHQVETYIKGASQGSRATIVLLCDSHFP